MAKTYEAMQKTGREPSTGWHFFDLKNRKQTGDLEKRILQFQQKSSYKIFNFCSARGKEGVSTILVNLVHYIKTQNSDKKILVVDANFQSPMLHNIFNAGNNPGLSEILSNEQNHDEYFFTLELTNITILTCGQMYRNQAGNFNQDRFANLLKASKEHYDYILIDSAPMLTSADALSVAVSSDVTFLIIQSTVVQKEVALKAKRLLDDNECIIGGVLLNRIRQVIPEWLYKLT